MGVRKHREAERIMSSTRRVDMCARPRARARATGWAKIFEASQSKRSGGAAPNAPRTEAAAMARRGRRPTIACARASARMRETPGRALRGARARARDARSGLLDRIWLRRPGNQSVGRWVRGPVSRWIGGAVGPPQAAPGAKSPLPETLAPFLTTGWRRPQATLDRKQARAMSRGGRRSSIISSQNCRATWRAVTTSGRTTSADPQNHS